MEVIIAIGIILAGLVGVTALVPVAARNAQVAMESDRSVSESTSAAALGAVHSFNDLKSLVIMDKPVFGSLPTAASYSPSGAMVTVQSKLDVVPYARLESPGFSHMPDGSGLSAGICIDPLGFPELGLDNQFVGAPGNGMPFNAPDGGDSAFDPSRFPYYNETVNPLAPPNQQNNNWTMAPRMWRATLKAPMYVGSPPPVFRHQLLSSSVVRSIFRSSSGLSPFGGSEQDSPTSLLVSQTNIGGSIVDASTAGGSDYTWFATLAPPFLGGNSFRQSIVVVRQRQAPVPQRVGDPLALQKKYYPIEKADDNPSSERITWIDPTTVVGFQGGVGGDVMIYGSQAVETDINVNEWVLLSRQPHVFDEPMARWVPTGPAIHRWFRVLRVGDVETDDAYALGGNTFPVWRRRVTLAGPDWAFQDGAVDAGGNPTPIDDTFCTIVRGAVSVHESEVQIQW
jgi:hypothetical protein